MLKLILLLLLHTVCIRGACDYSIYFSDFEGFKVEHFANLTILRFGQNTVIPDGGTVTLYCEPEFEWDFTAKGGRGNGERSEIIGPSLTIFCSEQQARFAMKNGVTLVKGDFYPENSIKCKGAVDFYAAKLDHCDNDGMRLGVSIKNTPVVFLELCYDIVKSEPIFLHYVAAQRSNILEKQIEYNPSNVTQSDLNAAAKMIVTKEIPPEIVIDTNYTVFTSATKHLVSGIDYKYNEITSSTLYSFPQFVSSSHHVNSTFNSIPWWTPLRNGNWKAFENILSRQLMKGKTYSIYAGKSHKVTYPRGFVCNWENEFMTYDRDGRKKLIPLFIWNYIIPRNEDDDSKEFVLIAINSPFVDFSNKSSMVICEDICDRIAWLAPLQSTRKASSFGYMFCCHPKDVCSILDGFPLGTKCNTSNNITSDSPANVENAELFVLDVLA